MTTLPLPVEGWARTWSSYRAHIVRSVVALMRDHGPVDAARVHAEIRRVATGGDVVKASPTRNRTEGAALILNLLISDIDVIRRTDDGLFVVDADVREARSAMFDQTFPVPTADEAVVAQARLRRETQLRRWLTLRPFDNEWKDGLRVHDEADVIALADEIELIGYCGPLIVKDQNGLTIDGHLREQALSKLGRDPARYSQTIVFRSDLHRLAYIYAVHRGTKAWPTVRKAIEKVVRKGRARARDEGDIRWPDDLHGMFGNQDTPAAGEVRLEPAPPISASPVQPAVQETEGTDVPTVETRHSASPEDMSVLEHYGDPLSDRQLAALIGEPYNKVNPKVSRCVQSGLLIKVGKHSDGSRITELTDAGRACVARRPWEWFPRGGDGVDNPGLKVKDSFPPSVRLNLVRQLLRREAAFPGEGWMNRADMDADVAKAAFGLRRAMWFEHVDGSCYAVIPDTLRKGWERLRLRKLTAVETGNFRDGCSTFDDTCRMWADLVRREHGTMLIL
ncbi:MAG TPA: hypothetical protein VIQ02_12140 [Jiangellaceae bacterium]